MATVVIMPRQGQSVETCILGQWYKKPGDEVKAGDLLFSYETDKAAFDEEAKADGILLARYFEEGDEVEVLAPVAVIGNPGEVVDELPVTGSKVSMEEPEEPSAKIIEFTVEPDNHPDDRVRISPLARNMAVRLGISYTSIQGTGPQGRIIARDIEAAAQTKAAEVALPKQEAEKAPEPLKQARETISAPAEPAPGDGYLLKPLSNMRKLIAKAMHQSLQNSAQLTHHLSADARRLMAARKKYKKEYETGMVAENVTINDLVCYAVVRALKKFPQVNSHFLGDQMKYFKKVNLGLAVDTDRGLMVPALTAADDLSVTGLSGRLRSLSESCRKGNVNPDLLSPEAASFTVSNLGNYGVEMFTPVINLPQTAILGVCAITPRPRDIGDGVYAIVPMIGLSLTYDHRALDGGEATRFLAEVAREIENL